MIRPQAALPGHMYPFPFSFLQYYTFQICATFVSNSKSYLPCPIISFSFLQYYTSQICARFRHLCRNPSVIRRVQQKNMKSDT